MKSFSVTGVFSVLMLYLLDNDLRKKISFPASHILVFFASAIVVSILFYSSFFSNNAGILDSIKTFTNYFTKAGANSNHNHPWYYYFELMLYSNNDKVFFSEILILLFSFIGIYFSFFCKKENQGITLFKFLSLFSLLQLIVYSAIPYKTPWLALNFWIGFLMLAAFGITMFYLLFIRKAPRVIFTLFIALVLLHNLWQTYNINLKYPYQPENPFTYSQATFDVVVLTKRITDISDSIPEGKKVLINVVAPVSDYWPLPWYLRKFKNHSIAVLWKD